MCVFENYFYCLRNFKLRLALNILSLCYLGYDWEKKVDEQTKPSLLKLAWNIMKLILIIATALVLVIIASYIAATQNPYLGKKIRNMMHDRNIAYIVARYMRKISLPLHNIVDLKRAQKWECLVQNPFYKSGEHFS